jgi:hypothetical protein
MLWCGLLRHRKALGKSAGGEVFGQLVPHRRPGDDAVAGEELFDLAAARPRRSTPSARRRGGRELR